MVYYFESDRGCGLRVYRTDASAAKRIREEVGTYSPLNVRRATKQDVEWVESMGGAVPAAAIKIKHSP